MIANIRLQNYRSYKDAQFEFEPGVNVIVGPNASGKTNLMEAILVLGQGKSYRVDDAELVNHGAPWARVDGVIEDIERTLKIVEKTPGIVQKEFEIQSIKYKRLSSQKVVPIVLFEPDHLQLLSGSPDMRRDYLDGILSQTQPGYSNLLKQYKRALRQRNVLLKQGFVSNDQIFVWNIRLGQLGGQVANYRIELVRKINELAEACYGRLSKIDGFVVDVQYSSGCSLEQYSSDLLYKLENNLEKDIQRGFTSYGPHRDDMVISFNGRRLQETASRGETRTMLLVLKTIELQIIEEHSGKKPILLLDDVFSELDGARRHALTDALKDQQTFITTTDADIVVRHFMDKCRVIAL